MTNWTVLSKVWPGGIEVDSNNDSKLFTAKGRFLLRAVERDERIAQQLFEKAWTAFIKATVFADFDSIKKRNCSAPLRPVGTV